VLRQNRQLALGAGVALAFIGVSLADFADGKRRFDTRASVEMSYFGTLFASQPFDVDDDGVMSPDGRWVVKVTHRGVLPQGVTEGTLWLFDAVALQRNVNHPSLQVPPPTPLATMSAAVNGIDFVADRGNTIYLVKWARDSRGLTFLGRDGQENRRLFQMDLQARKVTAVSFANQDVVNYVVTKNGFIYLAAADRNEDQEWRAAGAGILDIQNGTGSSLIKLLYPHFFGDGCCEPMGLGVWQVSNGHAEPIVNAKTGNPVQVITKYGAEVMGLSPDEGRLATIGFESTPKSESDTPLHYRIVDLNTGSSETLLEKPIFPINSGFKGRYRAVWSPDASAIAVSVLSESEALARADDHSSPSCEVGIINMSSHHFDCVMRPRNPSPGVLYSMYWAPNGSVLGLRYRQWGNGLYEDQLVERKHGVWVASMRQRQPHDLPLQLTVREGLNDPPVLLATDTDTDKERVVFDPNPQLKDFDLGVVSVYEWKDGHGRTIRGGLAKPPGYVAGRRYPLVIQTHGFDPHKFFRVGYGETANAGRALTSRDIMVLQVAEPWAPYGGTWEAAMENGTNVYLAAIEQLAADGLIDPKKVGLTGYSATGLFVSSAITRDPDRFAAAALSNTDNGSLTDYYTYIDYGGPGYAKYAGNLFAGARPYGDGLSKWIERAPEFSSDKITAPVLLSPANPHNLISLWSLYA
jgi:Prolyl oligopeptidase family